MSSGTTIIKKRPDISQLDYTFDLISSLTDDELEALQVVAVTFLKNKKSPGKDVESKGTVPFQPQSESQLLKRIDHSISQIKEGQYQEAEVAENEILEEIET